ncbi:MAG TPA: hypothetical protein VK658_28420 [Chryseolinea sp.]|nr:hypothetical protein [Chryseolinea sp.]
MKKTTFPANHPFNVTPSADQEWFSLQQAADNIGTHKSILDSHLIIHGLMTQSGLPTIPGMDLGVLAIRTSSESRMIFGMKTIEETKEVVISKKFLAPDTSAFIAQAADEVINLYEKEVGPISIEPLGLDPDIVDNIGQLAADLLALYEQETGSTISEPSNSAA